jgi:3-oxoacyl-[acyl-carrier protein] reductase
MNRLAGKTALVTGGNTGIGRAVCCAFADEGADVAVAWLERPDEADSLAQTIRARGRRCHPVNADVTRESDVRAMISSTLDALGAVDILVNNAGIQKAAALTEMTAAEWDRMMAVHLRGAFLCCRETAPHMIARGSGRIINVCSQLGYIGRERYTAYAAAKGGLIAFTRALAKELAPHGVLVNGVAPGLVDTGFDPLPDEVKSAHAAALPLKRLGTPGDMTSSFVFLASDEGRYYCGQLLHPNGGEIMP